MTDDIAPVVQHIGHAIAAHGQVNYDVRQEVRADPAVNDAVKAAVSNDGDLQQEDHLLAVVHNIGDVGLHSGLTLLEIIFLRIAVACGGKAVGIHFPRIQKPISLGNFIPDRHQILIHGVGVAENIRGGGLLKRRPVVPHPPFHRVRSHLCGGPQGFCHNIIDSGGIEQGCDHTDQH